MPFRVRKGSKAALGRALKEQEGAAREYGGVRGSTRKQRGSTEGARESMGGACREEPVLAPYINRGVALNWLRRNGLHFAYNNNRGHLAGLSFLLPRLAPLPDKCG